MDATLQNYLHCIATHKQKHAGIGGYDDKYNHILEFAPCLCRQDTSASQFNLHFANLVSYSNFRLIVSGCVYMGVVCKHGRYITGKPLSLNLTHNFAPRKLAHNENFTTG